MASVEDQDKTEEPLKETLDGFAVRVTVGAGVGTEQSVTNTTAEAVPNPPVELDPVIV